MPETIQDFYVDSESVGSYNNFDIHLPHPVIVEDDEKAFIRLKDYQQLNSFYNISNDLQNNTLGIIQTNRTYSRTPNGTTEAYINPTNLFNTSGTYIYKPITNPAWNGVAHTETITPAAGDYTIRLYDPTITTTTPNAPITEVRLSNIFTDTPLTNYMTFNPDDYIVFYNFTTPTSGRFIDQLTFSIENVASAFNNPTAVVNITFKVLSSIDGITWIENGLDAGNAILSYATNQWTTATLKTKQITLISTDTYSYHKVSFITSGFTTPATDFKSKIRVKQIYLTRITSFSETFTDGVALSNYTIEDGAYSITNLNLYLNYLLKQDFSSNLTFTTSYPLQPFLIAQNKQILTWSSVEPDFLYTPANKTDENYKIEIVFNSVLKKMLGWTSANPIIFKNDIPTEAPNYLNLINFKKILITSSLKLTTKPYTYLNKNYTKATGIGDVIAWINKDIPAFSYINWINPTDYKIEIDDKLITKINFKILNEYAQVLNDIPSCLFLFQIIKEKI